MSPFLEFRLRLAGWRPGRKVKVDKAVAAIQAEGFAVHETASVFLKEYGGISLTYFDHKWGYCWELGTGDCPCTPSYEHVVELHRRVGPSVPIAVQYANSLAFNLFMAESGATFKICDTPFLGTKWDGVVWGPWPSAIESLEAEITFRDGPVFFKVDVEK
jgi:hypothetical protein